MRERCLKVKEMVGMTGLLDSYGIQLKRGRCACPIHGGDNPDAFFVTRDDKGYVCNTKGCKGDVIALVEHMQKLDTMGAVQWLEAYAGIEAPSSSTYGKSRPKTAVKPPVPSTEVSGDSEPVEKAPRAVFHREPSNTWRYRDKEGNIVFEVKRFNEVGGGKRKQVKPYTNGRPGLKDENRILYNMDLMTASPDDVVLLVEGEKCAEAVTKLGYIGTCNPMGSGQWKAEFGYGEALRDRKVILMPDADEEAEKWVEAIKEDLLGKVRTLQIGEIPAGFITNNPDLKGHDIADFIEVHDEIDAVEFIEDVKNNSTVMPYGCEPGIIVTPNDALAELVDMHRAGNFERIQFNKWIKGLNVVAYASDLVTVMAQTGTGKTRMLHNIPFHITDLQYMMFDLELSRGILGLRYASMATGRKTKDILASIKAGKHVEMPEIDHIHLDNSGNIDLQYMKDRIALVEDITQRKIEVVGIDYIGLMKKKGFNSRYGALSEHVETFKGFLNETERTGLISTQCGRSAEKEEGYFQCPSMFAAKDSGSVENSSQLVLRVWRTDPNERNRLSVNVGKWSHDEPPEGDFELYADGLLITSEIEWKARQVENNQTDVEF